MSKRKVCVVVTARPSYSRIKSAIKELKDNDQVELQLVLAASALLNTYGDVRKVIEKDGFTPAYCAHTVVSGQNLISMAKTCGLGMIEMASAFENLNPDLVVTIADRYETMSTALAAAYLNIPLVHVQGGEVTGSIDEKVRHAITKLSDIHLVSNEEARERVIKMGEYPHKVFNTGCPSIDIAREVMSMPKMDLDPLRKYGGVGASVDIFKPFIVVMQHPVTTEHEMAKDHVSQTLQAIHELKIPALWFWPNVDAGSDGTSNGIRSFREKYELEHVHFIKNMEPEDFLRVLRMSKGIVGNSSVALRECSYLGVPAVNIGSRQAGRNRGNNVIDCEYHTDAIITAVKVMLEMKGLKSEHIYGDGFTGKRIAQILSTVELSFEKKLAY